MTSALVNGTRVNLTDLEEKIYDYGWEYYFDDEVKFIPKTKTELKLFIHGYTDAIKTVNGRG